MLEVLHYGFMQRAFIAGAVIAIIAPIIGIFLVLRRYSLIADTLSHVSLAGIAIGLLANINPLITALGASAGSALIIDRLRTTKKMYGESALSIFLSGSLALAIVLIGLSHGFNVDLFSYLFGSIVTIKNSDIYLITVEGVVVLFVTLVFFKHLLFIAFDEEAARVSGIPVSRLNATFILLAATTISLSIPIVGILLISALLVLPAIIAIQFKKGFAQTVLIAQAVSLLSVLSGIVASFYLNISSGGTIVLLLIAILLISIVYNSYE